MVYYVKDGGVELCGWWFVFGGDYGLIDYVFVDID